MRATRGCIMNKVIRTLQFYSGSFSCNKDKKDMTYTHVTHRHTAVLQDYGINVLVQTCVKSKVEVP